MISFHNGTWYRCRVAAINTGSGVLRAKLNTGQCVSLKRNCAHVKFAAPAEGAEADADDVVHFDISKYGKQRVFKNTHKSFAWVRRVSEIPQHKHKQQHRSHKTKRAK